MTLGGMPWKDRSKHNEHARKRYREDAAYRVAQKSRVAANNKRNITLKREVIAKWRAEGCSLCGETELCCLVAHHLDPQKKEDHVSRMIFDRTSWGRFLRELKKCVCLCRNCHAKVHAGVVDLAPVAQVVRAPAS